MHCIFLYIFQRIECTVQADVPFFIRITVQSEERIVIRASIREQKRNLVLIDACILNQANEVCTKATCTYFTYPAEKARQEMFFEGCKVEEKDENPLI